MRGRPDSNLKGFSLELARQIDEVCLRFEAAWREGRHPQVGDFLDGVLSS